MEDWAVTLNPATAEKYDVCENPSEEVDSSGSTTSSLLVEGR
jgi:hypothetical protein